MCISLMVLAPSLKPVILLSACILITCRCVRPACSKLHPKRPFEPFIPGMIVIDALAVSGAAPKPLPFLLLYSGTLRW